MSCPEYMPDYPIKFSQRVYNAFPYLFMIWLVLTVFSPHQDLYKAFFYLIILPAGLILLFSGQQRINWKDPLLIVSLMFFGYAGLTTLVIGLGPVEHHYRAFRWSVEISIGLIMFYLWMPRVVQRPAWWGRVFLSVALLGAAAGIFIFIFIEHWQGRLTGLGALHQWVQVAYVLLLYIALGQFLLTRSPGPLSGSNRVLFALSLIIVCLAVLLSQSRTSIAAMLIYLGFLGFMQIINKRKVETKIYLVTILGIVITLVALNQLYSFQEYIDRLLVRGFSARFDLWTGYFMYIPDSWLLGYGAGTDPFDHPAAAGYWEPNKMHISHPHNLFLGTMVDTGIIGLTFLLTLIYLVVRNIIKHVSMNEEKIRLIGILGLIFILSMTGGQTIISSIKAIWLYLWIPVVLIWFWCRNQDVTISD